MPNINHSENGSNRTRTILVTVIEWVRKASQYILLTVLIVWTILGLLHLDVLLPVWMTYILVLGLGAGMIFTPRRRNHQTRYRRIFAVVGVSWILMQLLFLAFVHPSHNRNWGIPHVRLPSATIDGNQVTVHDIRSFRYKVDGTVIPNYFDSEFDLDQLDEVWFGVDHFTEFQPIAHTFLSFGFIDQRPIAERSDPNATHRYVAVSIETRRETHEEDYSPIGGLFRKYEIIYVIADEQDVLGLRSSVRQNPVLLYPMKGRKPQMRAMFLDIMKRTNRINRRPEFYHTLYNNCTNNLVYHKNNIMTNQLSAFQRGVIFPGYSDWLAYQNGLLDTDLSFADAKKQFRIDQRIIQFGGQGDFSSFIRKR